jgi:hypothetical protein
MPSLSSHHSTQIVKGLLLGDPGAGKTGALDALLDIPDMQIRIYDFDNLLGSLVQYASKNHPNDLDRIKYQVFTDKMKIQAQPVTMVGNSLNVMPASDGAPTAYGGAMRQLTHWKTPEEDLGPASEFGPNVTVVVDSLTTMSQAAFRYCQYMNPAAREPRTTFYAAQQLVLNAIQLLCSEQFRTNVLVLAHITYDKNHLDLTKGFPRSIGAALNEQLAAYFNCVLLAESQGSGASVKRVIRTNSTGIVDLKNPISFKVPDTLPLETGLATFFRAVREAQPKKEN